MPPPHGRWTRFQECQACRYAQILADPAAGQDDGGGPAPASPVEVVASQEVSDREARTIGFLAAQFQGELAWLRQNGVPTAYQHSGIYAPPLLAECYGDGNASCGQGHTRCRHP